MAFDVKCYALAKTFLEDRFAVIPEHTINELAQQIQNTIEDFMQYEVKIGEA